MSNRPSVLQVGGTLYWVILTRNPDTSVLKDADSTPTVAVRKNGASTADSVTITKRSATTGIYDCSYNPASEIEGDKFTFEESVTITGTTTAQAAYQNNWDAVVIAVERGTDGANTTTPPTVNAIADGVWDEAYADHTLAGSFGKLLNTIRKANLAIEGVVSNAITPTTLTFSSNVSATTSAYAHAVLLFVSGPLAGENSPIISYNNTNGVFVLEEPLTAAPSDGDEFVVIAGSHVHAIADIADAIDINVAPFSATLPQRVQGTRVDVFYKEAIAITIAVFDESNDPVDLTTQGSLRVCIERRDGTDLQTIENANITIGGGDSNQFTFTCDATATGTLGQHYWSLRRTTNNEVLAHGQWQVLPAAFDT